jgi:hypothetical protein
MTNDLRRGHVHRESHWLAKSSSILGKLSRLSNPCFIFPLKVINVLRMYGSSVRRYLVSSRRLSQLFTTTVWSLRKVPPYNRGTMTCEVASKLIFLVYNVTMRKSCLLCLNDVDPNISHINILSLRFMTTVGLFSSQ